MKPINIIKLCEEDEQIIKQAMWNGNHIAVQKTSGLHPYHLIIGDENGLKYVKDSYFYDDEAKAIAELDRLASLKTKKFTKKDKISFAKSIDLEPLTNAIKEFTGANNIKIDYEITDDSYNNSCRIEFDSNDIKEYCGVFGKVMRYVKVCNFSSCVRENRDHTALRAWISVHLHYQHLDGGRNGVELFRAQYEDGKWQFDFRDEK